MKIGFKSIAYALLLVWIIPSFVLSFYSMKLNDQNEEEFPAESETTNSLHFNYGAVNLLLDGEVISVGWEDYFTGVLLSEMPGIFHFEAKKAQAVVARTYASKVMQMGSKHPLGAVCGNPNCCQGYLPIERYMAVFADASVVEGARMAVRDTAGLVVVYDGVLIDATYFSCSGGKTENAVAVWGTDVPYLQTVDSPGEEFSVVYTDTVVFAPEEFMNKLGVHLSGSHESWFGSILYTEGGGVQSISICGQVFSGTDMRMKLGLRSTAFSIETTDSEIRISTKGFGHRVGMSQYGADAMGRSGKDFRQIIQHYYQGVEIVPMDCVAVD